MEFKTRRGVCAAHSYVTSCTMQAWYKDAGYLSAYDTFLKVDAPRLMAYANPSQQWGEITPQTRAVARDVQGRRDRGRSLDRRRTPSPDRGRR